MVCEHIFIEVERRYLFRVEDDRVLIILFQHISYFEFVQVNNNNSNNNKLTVECIHILPLPCTNREIISERLLYANGNTTTTTIYQTYEFLNSRRLFIAKKGSDSFLY